MRSAPLGGSEPDAVFAAPAEVAGVLPTGRAWIVALTCGGDTLFALRPAPPAVAPGDRITGSASRDAPHLFDDAGRRCDPTSLPEAVARP